MVTAAIIPAAGKGIRMGAGTPKQFLFLKGRSILEHTLAVFEDCPQVDLIIPVLPPDWEQTFPDQATVLKTFKKISEIVSGGNQRQDSVRNGLSRVPPEADLILVHDAVRPFVSLNLIRSCIEAAYRCGAAVAALQAQETVKQVDSNGRVERTLPRDTIYMAQTPQAFRRHILEEALNRAQEQGFYGTDETSLVERMGLQVQVILGEKWNIKITTQEDLAWAQLYAQGMEMADEAK